jgi:voltage-gated potassium channel
MEVQELPAEIDNEVCVSIQPSTGLHRQLYDLFILFLSIYVIAQMALEIVTDWSIPVNHILERIDLVICLIFLGDWTFFFWRSENKHAYFKARLLDLISSIPYVQLLRPFRIARVVRLVRVLRLMRGLKGVFPIIRIITKSKARSALTVYCMATLVIYLYCALGMLNFEKGTNDGIKCFNDALWCAFTTLTTVGYGDIYPKTGGGRVMAGILVITGMGLFSMVTAEFASLFLTYMREERGAKSEESD